MPQPFNLSTNTSCAVYSRSSTGDISQPELQVKNCLSFMQQRSAQGTTPGYVIYSRSSTADISQRELQAKNCLSFAQQRGWNLAEKYVITELLIQN